jgi:hypothetical protein
MSADKQTTLRIENGSDTGPNDGYFCEWWSVIDEATGETLCKCDEESTAKRILAALAAHQAQQEPVAWRAKFKSEPWGPHCGCSKEHYESVKANPESWPGYEAEELYAAPQQAQAPGWQLARVSDGDIRVYGPDKETWLIRKDCGEGFYDFIHRYFDAAIGAAPQGDKT